MKKTKIGALAVAILLVGIALAAMPAEAKYWTTKYGHPVIVYEAKDIPSNLKSYVAGLEYDMAYYPGYDYGARLYFTSYGKNCARYLCPGVVESMTNFVMSAPEWFNERSVASVRSEIYQHGLWPGKMVVDIQYFCSDLESWEQPYKNYC